jgi:hypothetical protein
MNDEAGIKKYGSISGVGAMRKPRPASCFAPFLSASALAAADALGGFAFNSGIKKSTPSHRVAVSRSDVGGRLGKS